MEKNRERALDFKELAYLYADRVCEYLLNSSYKTKNKDNSLALSRLIKATHNTIDSFDLEKGSAEDVFKTIVRYKLILDNSYPKNPEKTFVFNQEMDDFYVKVLSSYLDLLLPGVAPYDVDVINKVTELRARAKAYYVTGVTGEALLESLTVTGLIDHSKCLSFLSEEVQNERNERWNELTTKNPIKLGVSTDDDFLDLANNYLDTVLPCLTLFYSKNITDEELEEETALEVCTGKAYVLNEVVNNRVNGLGILEAAVNFKILEEKKYLDKNNTVWHQGPEDLEAFYIGILNKAISMSSELKTKEEKLSYINDISLLYSTGYSAESLFESFAGQPLDDTKKIQDVKSNDMITRKRTFECIKRA